jgi:hypothetical protein
MTSESHLQQIENQIADVDLDRMAEAGAQATSPPAVTPSSADSDKPIAMATPPTSRPVESKPTSPASVATASNYFPASASSSGTIQSDVPITNTKFSFKNIDPTLIRRIAIIGGAIIILGIAGFVIANIVIGSQQAQQTSAPEKSQEETPAITEPEFTDTDTETETETTPSATTETETETTTNTDTETETETPAEQAPAVTTPSPPPTTPTSTPAATETVPTVANSGIQ